MKRFFTFAFMLLCLFTVQTAAAQTIWDGTTDTEWLGTGTQADPYQISTPQELAGLAELVNNKTKDFAGEYICLTADIYLHKEDTPDSLKREWPRIGGWTREQNGENFAYDSTAFCGNFDGRNHTIYGIYCSTMPSDTTNWDNPFEDFIMDFSGWERGFFGYLQDATVENLKIHRMIMNGGANMGGLSPYASNSTIRNVHITESVVASSSGDYGGGAGGLVGQLMSCLVEDCTVDAHVQGTRGIGVLAGFADSATVIRNCSTSGDAYMTEYVCGGFIGQNAGLIERCSSSADASRGYYSYAFTSGIPDCAGFVGENSGTIRDCYSTGNIVNTVLEGHGFCGQNTGRLESCYSTGNVEGRTPITVSAFCGQNGITAILVGSESSKGEIINCFGTGQCTITDPDQPYAYYHGFTSDAETGISMIANGYHDKEKNPNGYDMGGSFGVTTAYLQSQAFVDTLNMMAALKGLTKWQYNAGGYPTLTEEKATNLTDYLAGGSGTKDDPYRIETKEHLKNFATYVNHGYHFAGEYILQTTDIALNPPFEKWSEEAPELWQTIGKSVTSANNLYSTTFNYSFRGTYDGGLHEIQNLYCYSVTKPQGLFGFLGNDAHICNLGITDVWIFSGADNSGILATGPADDNNGNIDIRNCWTSGLIESQGWAAGGFLGGITNGGQTNILNCYSFATIRGTGYTKAVVGDQNYIGGEAFSNDTVGNFFYYGRVPNLQSGISQAGREITSNFFFNRDSVDDANTWPTIQLEEVLGGRTTAYMYSKEFVNDLNYWVSQWNETHTDPLYYWQHRENDYPFYTTNVPEHYTITFVTNGGSAVTPQYVLPESKMVVPAVPTKEGDLFAGWYADEALTEVFDVEQLITSDITLYARWVKADYDADYSIFGNQFAKAFTIKTKEQLNALRHIVNGTSTTYNRDILVGKTIKLGNDIVLNDTTDWQYWGTTASATPWFPIGANETYPFNYTFDGQGYKIIGLYANANRTVYASSINECIGLFGWVETDAVIKNVGIVASYVEGNAHVGALAGLSKAPITNCYARACVVNPHLPNVSGHGNTGLLVGETTASMTDCYAIGEVSGIDQVGGLVGAARCSQTDTIRHCYAHVNVTGRNDVGGLIGYANEQCVIEECYAKGDVVLSAELATDYYPCQSGGGLVGSLSGTVYDCYAMGTFYSEGTYSGCIAGKMEGNIYNSYYVGEVSGLDFDGLAYSWWPSNTKTNSYYNADLCTLPTSNGDSIYGRTTAQMKTYETYATWDFGDVWGMRATYNEGYPYLQHFLPEELRGQVEAIYLDARQLTMVQQTTETLQVTFRPATATCELVWESENPAIVEVNNGVLTAKTVGTTVIRVQDVAGTVSDSCVVTVVATAADIPSITVHFHNTMSWSKVYLYAWSTDGLQTEYLGASPGTEMTPMKDNWYSYTFDPRITDVNFRFHSGDGKQSSDLHTDQDVCYRWENWDVKLVDCDTSLPSDVEQVTLSATSLSLTVGETHTLVATVLPADAPNKNVTWESSAPSIVSVDNAGNLTALAVGSATITVTTEEGKKKANCQVVVSPAVISVTGVTLSETTLALNVGDTHTLIATVMPANATNTAVTWSSSATNIVSVDNGVLTARVAGEATITVTTEDGEKQATCVVTVIDPNKVAGVELNVHELTLEIGQTYTLIANVFPETAVRKDVFWYTDNSDVVSVADWRSGIITAEQVGTAAVWAETVFDGNFTDTCYVTVVEEGATTALEYPTDNSSSNVRKVFENGTIYIIRNDERYMLDGRKVD